MICKLRYFVLKLGHNLMLKYQSFEICFSRDEKTALVRVMFERFCRNRPYF